ncbi:MAG: cob(I)yrinic acid a,c-diamide adenosyltransferase [Lepagella sp.]
MEQGFIHIYTGDGKGKTTAAFGLALRALCAGKNVAIGQFVKSMRYNETKSESLFNSSNPDFGLLHIEQFGQGCCIDRKPDETDRTSALYGLSICREWLSKGKWDVVILDEVTIALWLELLDVKDVIDLVQRKHVATEVVITGRYAPQDLIDIADLVTDMREVKHYYSKGVLSRNGIDH